MSVMNDDTLVIGATRINEEFFDGQLSEDQVYRLPKDGWPIFKLLGKIAARPSAMRAEIARREAEAAKRGERAG
jgi:hypothetical protein